MGIFDKKHQLAEPVRLHYGRPANIQPFPIKFSVKGASSIDQSDLPDDLLHAQCRDWSSVEHRLVSPGSSTEIGVDSVAPRRCLTPPASFFRGHQEVSDRISPGPSPSRPKTPTRIAYFSFSKHIAEVAKAEVEEHTSLSRIRTFHGMERSPRKHRANKSPCREADARAGFGRSVSINGPRRKGELEAGDGQDKPSRPDLTKLTSPEPAPKPRSKSPISAPRLLFPLSHSEPGRRLLIPESFSEDSEGQASSSSSSEEDRNPVRRQCRPALTPRAMVLGLPGGPAPQPKRIEKVQKEGRRRSYSNPEALEVPGLKAPADAPGGSSSRRSPLSNRGRDPARPSSASQYLSPRAGSRGDRNRSPRGGGGGELSVTRSHSSLDSPPIEVVESNGRVRAWEADGEKQQDLEATGRSNIPGCDTVDSVVVELIIPAKRVGKGPSNSDELSPTGVKTLRRWATERVGSSGGPQTSTFERSAKAVAEKDKARHQRQLSTTEEGVVTTKRDVSDWLVPRPPSQSRPQSAAKGSLVAARLRQSFSSRSVDANANARAALCAQDASKGAEGGEHRLAGISPLRSRHWRDSDLLPSPPAAGGQLESPDSAAPHDPWSFAAPSSLPPSNGFGSAASSVSGESAASSSRPASNRRSITIALSSLERYRKSLAEAEGAHKRQQQ